MLVITPALSIFNCLQLLYLQRTSFTGVLPDSIWLTNYNYLHITLLHEPWKRILAEAIWISDRNSWRISLPPEKFQPEKLKTIGHLQTLFNLLSTIPKGKQKSSLRIGILVGKAVDFRIFEVTIHADIPHIVCVTYS